MPIYAYQCGSCGHELEALQKMADAPLTECPACSQHALSKQVTAAAFRLSGAGWYETDFKNGSKKNVASTDAAPSSACGTGTCPACQP
jgi:putative FmdB family regulatory protein